uniref:Uncharacterized protein n=1 Tax=Setaria digitata TaxID=48799 RepID=A0A915PUW0_9BILA
MLVRLREEVEYQVFLKSQQTDVMESEYVLVEETIEETGSTVKMAPDPNISKNNTSLKKKSTEVLKPSECKTVSVRVLASNEIVWKAQNKWKMSGRFILENREDAVHSTREKVRNLLQALENAHVSVGPSPSVKDRESGENFRFL